MEIDRNSLPEDPAALRQMVMGVLEELDAKERRLRRVQHLLEQLLRWRYGQKRERVDENQLFLFAVALVSAGKDQTTPPVEPDTPPAPAAASTAPVLDPALPRTRTGKIWTYVGNHPSTVYDYTSDRSREGPDAFLREFTGFSRPTPARGTTICTRIPSAASSR